MIHKSINLLYGVVLGLYCHQIRRCTYTLLVHSVIANRNCMSRMDSLHNECDSGDETEIEEYCGHVITNDTNTHSAAGEGLSIYKHVHVASVDSMVTMTDDGAKEIDTHVHTNKRRKLRMTSQPCTSGMSQVPLTTIVTEHDQPSDAVSDSGCDERPSVADDDTAASVDDISSSECFSLPFPVVRKALLPDDCIHPQVCAAIGGPKVIQLEWAYFSGSPLQFAVHVTSAWAVMESAILKQQFLRSELVHQAATAARAAAAHSVTCAMCDTKKRS
jgi:hypothetical protein